MRATEPTQIVVGANDAIPDVLTRLRTATGGSATLIIPAASSLFLTASEFRALKATTDQARITLTVETDDRLRKQLATMFKIPADDIRPAAPDQRPEPEPHATFVEAPPVSAVAPDLPKLDLAPAIEVVPKWEPREDGDDNGDDLEIPPRRKVAIPFRAIGVGLAALVAVVALAAAAEYLLRTGTVEIILARQPVSAELTYAVVSPGAETPEGALFTVNAEPVTLEVPYRETIDVTGELREPDQIATGRIALRNPSSDPVEIAAGETFTDRNGVDYTFVDPVNIPAADESTGAGRADASIRAAVGGEAANRDIGMLSGQLDNGIYYSNRDTAVAGGSDRVTRVVSQEDIDQLVANANQQLQQRLVGAPLPDGRIVLPGTLQPGELEYTTDHQPGEQVETVSIDASMVVSAMAFNPADAVLQATDQLESSLEAATPAGYQLEHETLTTASPVLVNDQGNAGLYVLTATADALPVIDDATRDQIAGAVTGLGPDDAEAIVRAYPFATDVTVTTSPGILFSSLPGNAGKIEIETK
jgi:hypothetical protein